MLDGAIIVPLQALLWGLLFELAALIWIIDRALLIVAYFIMALTGWITSQVFAPLLTVVGQQTEVLVGPVFLLAITVLAFTYLMAVFGRFHVVSLRSAVLWLLFAAGLYTFGPNFYLGMELFRREVAGGFYEAGIDAFNSGGSVTGLDAIGTPPSDAVTVPTDQLGAFLPIPSVSSVDGVDVALAYLDADGYDMLGAAGPHPIARLPWNMVVAGGDGFFDPDTGPDTFSTLTDAERNESIARALQGVARLLTGTIIALFAVVEQLVHFILAASFAVAFLSMFVATLFGFFIRTEPIAWSALELVIELFIQTLVNSLLMSLVVGFVLIGANSGNAILLLGGGAAGLFMAWNLMQGTLKGLMNATERLYKSFASATGGNFATVSETTESMGTAAVSAATGAAVLAGGGSFLQAAGGAFGDARTAQTMNYASRMLGGEDTLLGRAAEAVGEGASARTMGGPVGGALLGAQNRRNRQEEAEREERLNYTGEADNQRDAAVNDYRRTDDRTALDDGFDDDDARRVAALSLAYVDDTFDTVANTVRRVRNANPDLPPDSPAFQRQVRDALPSDMQTIETAALADFSTTFGASADPTPSRYDKATALMQPIRTPGAADEARDDALRAYRLSGDEGTLTDAFSPDDANRVARLMDAYDDDDFAAVISAVRAARDTNPDAEPGSTRALTAARNELPPSLAQMPSSDLRAFSNAFGASATTPAVIAPEATAPAIYIGNRDQRRDAAVADYRATGDETGLDNPFSPLQVNQIMQLNDEYDDDDFEAVVRAVRQVRTDDPELEAGSTRAVRAARRQLPDRLRQIPSEDLTAFSNIFGEEADTPTVSQSAGRRRTPQPSPDIEPVPLSNVMSEDDARMIAGAFGVEPDEMVIMPTRARAAAPASDPTPAATADASTPAPPPPAADVAPANPNARDGSANIPQVILSPTPSEAGATPVSQGSSLTDISGIGPSTQAQLRGAGIQTVGDLAAADPAQLAQLPRVTQARATAWVAAAAAMTAANANPPTTGIAPRTPVSPAQTVPVTPPTPSPVTGQSTAPATVSPAQQLSEESPPRDYRRVGSPRLAVSGQPPVTRTITPQSVDEGPPRRDYSRMEPPPAAPAPQHRVETPVTPQQIAVAPPQPIEGAPIAPPAAPASQRRMETPVASQQPSSTPLPRPTEGAPPPSAAPAPQRRVQTPVTPQNPSAAPPRPTEGAPTSPPAAPTPQRRVETPVTPQQPAPPLSQPTQGAPNLPPSATSARQRRVETPVTQQQSTAAPPRPTEGAPIPPPAAPAPQRRVETPVASQQSASVTSPRPTEGAPTPPPAAPASQRRVETSVKPQQATIAPPPQPTEGAPTPAPAAPAPQRRVETPVTPQQPTAAPPPRPTQDAPTPPPAAPAPQRRVETPVTPQQPAATPPSPPTQGTSIPSPTQTFAEPPPTPEQKPPDPLAGQSESGDT